MQNQEAPKIVFLWTVFRACSTAFERSFGNRSDVSEYYHEPHSVPYYLGPHPRVSKRYPDGEESQSFRDVIDMLKKAKAEAKPGQLVFAKDMSCYLRQHGGEIDEDHLNELIDLIDIHTFLIRDPSK